MSSSVDAAQAVTDLINDAVEAGSFDLQFNAVREYVPTFAMEDREPAGISVTVTPTAHGNVNLTRAKNTQQPSVAVVIIKKLKEKIAAEIDPLIELVEQLKNLVSSPFAAGTLRSAGSLEVESLFDADKLVNDGLFWSKFTVNVQVYE